MVPEGVCAFSFTSTCNILYHTAYAPSLRESNYKVMDGFIFRDFGPTGGFTCHSNTVLPVHPATPVGLACGSQSTLRLPSNYVISVR